MLDCLFVIDEGKYLSHKAIKFRGEMQVAIWEVDVGRKVPHGFRTVYDEGPVHERLCKGMPHCIKFVDPCPLQRAHLMCLKKRFGRETGNVVPRFYRRRSRYLRKLIVFTFKYRPIGVSVRCQRASDRFHENVCRSVKSAGHRAIQLHTAEAYSKEEGRSNGGWSGRR